MLETELLTATEAYDAEDLTNPFNTGVVAAVGADDREWAVSVGWLEKRLGLLRTASAVVFPLSAASEFKMA